MIITKTPYRISFLGGKTDLPDWYTNNGGMVLSTTINKYCYISCRYLPPFFNHKYRLVYSRIENVKSPDEIEHPSVRECIKYLNFREGLEIHHDGDIPAWSGMGTSSSFTVGLLNALHGLKNRNINPEALAQQAIIVEQKRIGESVGSQDQVAAAYGGLNYINFKKNGKIDVEPLILEEAKKNAFNDHLMLVFTGHIRQAKEIEKHSIQNLPKKEKVLKKMMDLVPEGAKLLTSGDFESFGRLIDESWQLKKSISSKISTSAIEDIYSIGKNAGALGGKVLGAGGGGFVLFVVKPTNKAKIRKKLSRLLEIPFKFEGKGSQIIFSNNYRDF